MQNVCKKDEIISFFCDLRICFSKEHDANIVHTLFATVDRIKGEEIFEMTKLTKAWSGLGTKELDSYLFLNIFIYVYSNKNTFLKF